MVERLPEKQQVAGSKPALGTNFAVRTAEGYLLVIRPSATLFDRGSAASSSWLRMPPSQGDHPGSNPGAAAIFGPKAKGYLSASTANLKSPWLFSCPTSFLVPNTKRLTYPAFQAGPKGFETPRHYHFRIRFRSSVGQSTTLRRSTSQVRLLPETPFSVPRPRSSNG